MTWECSEMEFHAELLLCLMQALLCDLYGDGILYLVSKHFFCKYKTGRRTFLLKLIDSYRLS